jgi:Ion channel
MRFIWIALSLALIAVILVDCFETILQPRRVTHRYRFARLFYRNAWKLWRAIAAVLRGKTRDAFLSIFGPFSLLALFVSWMAGLIFAFAVIDWSTGSVLHSPDRPDTLWTYLYYSGTTFFTLGLGDVAPLGAVGRVLAIVEAGLGFGFIAMLISYLPVLQQAFSQRELTISLLDARAGSPPSAAQVLLRAVNSPEVVQSFLIEWERWAAELLESHLSFPVLSYYRSQHDNQSWLATLTTILDTCAILLAEVKADHPYRTQLTFAIARHAAVDLCLVLKTPPAPPQPERLPLQQLKELRAVFEAAKLPLRERGGDVKLAELRAMYEPFVNGLAKRFLLALPPFIPESDSADNWQRSAWMQRAPGIGSLPIAKTDEEHFE